MTDIEVAPRDVPFSLEQLAWLRANLSTLEAAPRAIAATGRIPDVVDGELIESAWGNAIRNRTVTPFATLADRDASTPAPPMGALCWTSELTRLWAWTGAAWIAVSASYLITAPLAGTIPNSTSPVGIGSTVIGAAPYARTVQATAQMTVSTTATAVWNLQVTNTAGATMFGRGRDNGTSTVTVLPFLLAADTPTTLTVTAAFTSAPSATGTVLNGSRLDAIAWPA